MGGAIHFGTATMKHILPTPPNLRRPESRLAASRLADQILRADSARARRIEANDRNQSRGNRNVTKRQALDPDSRHQPLRLTDLRRLHPLARGSRGRQ
jgi:hypothetical protein